MRLHEESAVTLKAPRPHASLDRGCHERIDSIDEVDLADRGGHPAVAPRSRNNRMLRLPSSPMSTVRRFIYLPTNASAVLCSKPREYCRAHQDGIGARQSGLLDSRWPMIAAVFCIHRYGLSCVRARPNDRPPRIIEDRRDSCKWIANAMSDTPRH